MRPPARRGRAQRNCEQYLDVLTVHTHSQNIPLADKGFFDKLKIVDLCRKKRNTAIPPRYRHVLKKGDFNTPPVNTFFKKENGGFDFDISRLLFSNFAQICC